DGKLLAGRSRGDRVILWDARTGVERRRLCVPTDGGFGQFWKIAFSPDSRTLATPGGAGHVALWDVETGKVARKLALPGAIEGDVGTICFSADGKRLLVGGANNAYLLDTVTGQVLHRFGKGGAGSVA